MKRAKTFACELRRITLPETVWKLRKGFILRFHASAERGEKAPFIEASRYQNRDTLPVRPFSRQSLHALR